MSSVTQPHEARSSFFTDLQRVLRQNIRQYGMFIALFVIWMYFIVATNGLFISARNISNLLNQTGYIAVMAVGVTLIIVIRHIDLSIGYLMGFLGAIAAIALKVWGLPVWVVIPAVLLLGIALGAIPAFMVANLGIPAFVATLAGWLAYKGLLVVVLSATGTIIIADEFFNAIGNGFIPDIVPSGSVVIGDDPVHVLTLILGLAAIAWYIVSQINNRRKKQAYNFEVMPGGIFVLQLIFVSILGLIATWILAGYNGLSWTVVIMLIVVAIYQFMTTQMVLGRHIYAVGGNPEAAQLSGINVKRITYIVFCSMSMLAALAGIMFASRLRSASPQAGTGFELDAIAAAFIGGVSAAGGVGSIVGSLIGALVYVSLTNGMNLMGTGSDAQNIVKGIVLAGAVIFDVATRGGSTKSLSKILFSFNGRINRQDYWLGLVLGAGLTLILSLTMNFIAYLVASLFPDSQFLAPQSVAYMALTILVIYVPALWIYFAIAVKRWHDFGLPGWWAVLNIFVLPAVIVGLIKGKESAGSSSTGLTSK